MRYNPTNDIGRNIFGLKISKCLGWIAREVTTSDVGIDFTLEEVVNGNPTARYLSVQLKTGLGNVDIDKNGDYIFRFGKTHYNYWTGSSLPVIIAICNPVSEEISWELISRHKILFAKKQYKIRVKKSCLLNSLTLDKFTAILNNYQSDFMLPEIENQTDKHSPEYWEVLLKECADAISNISASFYKISDSYDLEISKLSNFVINSHFTLTQKQINGKLNKFASSLALTLNVSRCTIKTQISIIRDSFFEVLNSISYVLHQNSWFNILSAKLVYAAFETNLHALESSSRKVEEVFNNFKNTSISSSTLQRSVDSFADIIELYLFTIKEMADRLREILRQFMLKFSIK